MDYISRDELRKHLAGCMTAEFFDSDMKKAVVGIDVYVENMPAADVQPVKYGEWRRKFLSDTICCSECKVTWSSSFKDMLNGFNYCPNCGARMDGDTP